MVESRLLRCLNCHLIKFFFLSYQNSKLMFLASCIESNFVSCNVGLIFLLIAYSNDSRSELSATFFQLSSLGRPSLLLRNDYLSNKFVIKENFFMGKEMKKLERKVRNCILKRIDIHLTLSCQEAKIPP